MSDVFFRAEHLKMQFYAGNKRKQMVLDDASFTVEQGEAVGIVGPSGAGKSTIARIICGLIRPEYGDIYFKGTHIVGAEKTFQKEFRTQIQLIPQQPYLSLDPKQKVGSKMCIRDRVNTVSTSNGSLQIWQASSTFSFAVRFGTKL